GIDALMDWHRLALVAVALTAVQDVLWLATQLTPQTWLGVLLFCTSHYLVVLAYPVVLGRRTGRAIEPHLAAVAAGAVFLLLARRCIIVGGFGDVIGILPLTQAALMLGLLWQLLRIEQPGARQPGRLALVAGAGLAFVTVAIPLQVDREWITIAWGLEA